MALRHLLVDAYYRAIHMDPRPAYRELMHNLSQSTAELELEQHKLLAAMLEHATASIPYYSGLAGETRIDDFPVLRKEDIDSSYARLIASELRSGLDREATGSGTTTRTALKALVDRESLTWARAAGWRAQVMRGVPLHSRALHLRKEPFGISRWQKLKRALGQLLMDNYTVDAYTLDARKVRDYHGLIRRLKPVYLGGFTGNLLAFVELSRELGLPPPRLHHIAAYGENIFASTREKISGYFGVPLHAGYGAREVGFVASTCEKLCYHTAPELLYLEVLDEQGCISRFGRGRLLVTTLRNSVMPLIRYDIGDLVVLSERRCACGSPLPVMEEIIGRTSEVVLRPDGVRVSSSALISFLSYMNVADWRVTQERTDELLVQIVPTADWGEGDVAKFNEQITRFLGSTMKVELRIEDSISPLRNGKRPQIRNLLPGRY